MAITTKELLSALKGLTGPSLTAARKILGVTGDVMGGKGLTGGMGIGDVDFLGGITKTGDELTKRYEARQQLLKDMGLMAQESTKAISQLEEASYNLFGTTEQGLQALTGLNQGMQSLAFFSSEAQMELAKGAMVLEQYGVGASDLGGILDTAAMSFGATQKELTQLTEELGNVVSNFPGQASQIAANFKSAQQSLLYDSNKVMTVFKRLQFTSTQTGVSFDALTDAFGDSMDTFEGSSKKAGDLNAILGKSVFNSIDLLGKTEAERVETIIAGVKKNVNVESLKNNKFQLKSVAQGLGLTPDQTRRLLSGKTTVDEALKEKESKDPRVRATKMLTNAMDANNLSIDQLSRNFELFRPELQNTMIQFGAENRKNLTNAFKEFIGGGAMGSEMRSMADVMDHLQLRLPQVLGGLDEQNKQAVLDAMRSGDLQGIMKLGPEVRDAITDAFSMTREEAMQLNRSRIKVIGGGTSREEIVKSMSKFYTDSVTKLVNGGFTAFSKAINGLTEAWNSGLTTDGQKTTPNKKASGVDQSKLKITGTASKGTGG